MLISDYANAFFFDRRNRVTPSNREVVLSRRREVAIAISKACPIMTKINIGGDTIAGTRPAAMNRISLECFIGR